MTVKPKFNKTEYDNRYQREHYDRINLIVPKGLKEEIKKAAESKGMNMSRYIISLIENDRTIHDLHINTDDE